MGRDREMMRCSRCGRRITKPVFIEGKPYGTECARFLLSMDPKSLRQKQQKAEKIFEKMLETTDKYEFKIKKLPEEYVRKHFPCSRINEAVVYRLRDKPNVLRKWGPIDGDPIVSYLVAQKMKIEKIF